MTEERKWIKFEQTRDTGKTLVWAVRNIEDSSDLGEVKWTGRWRCYAFFPADCTMFERACLRHIAQFCEDMTRFHRKNKL